MKRLAPVFVAMLLVATVGAGSVAAAARTPSVYAKVSRVAPQGGRIFVTVMVRHCDRKTAGNYTVTAVNGATTVVLKRMGVVRNPTSHSRSCVYRGRITVATNAPKGNTTVTVNVQRLAAPGGSPTGAPWTKDYRTRIVATH